MSTEIDDQSIEVLRTVVGKVLRQIMGQRYPGVAGYSELRLVEESGRIVSLALRTVDVDDDLEVFVPVARVVSASTNDELFDHFSVADFRIARVFRLQRRESIEPLTTGGEAYVGESPRQQLMTEVLDGDYLGANTVDAGLALEGEDGVSVECYADSFPLVFQLRLRVASSTVPTPRRVALA